MYRLMIADDEPKIRRGLSKLEWSSLNIEVVAQAEDGIQALKFAEEYNPDLFLIDINMPYLNGLELIKELKKVIPECLMIIVSGYDEFEYAKEAVKLDVFDYILKPVNRKELMETVKRAVQTLEEEQNKDNFIAWAQSKVHSDHEYMLSSFFRNWIAGKYNDYEIQQNLLVFNIQLEVYNYCLFIRVLPYKDIKKSQIEGDLLSFCIINILEELLSSISKLISIKMEEDVILAFIEELNPSDQVYLDKELKQKISKYLHREVLVELLNAPSTYKKFPEIYYKGIKQLDTEIILTPIVLSAKNYLEKNYSNKDLSLSEVAAHLSVSSAYLSRLIKKELNVTFTDLITQIRIEKAEKLMEDPTLKIYEVGDYVGYKSQHYFSAAFKKAKGVSPIAYRGETK